MHNAEVQPVAKKYGPAPPENRREEVGQSASRSVPRRQAPALSTALPPTHLLTLVRTSSAVLWLLKMGIRRPTYWDGSSVQSSGISAHLEVVSDGRVSHPVGSVQRLVSRVPQAATVRIAHRMRPVAEPVFSTGPRAGWHLHLPSELVGREALRGRRSEYPRVMQTRGRLAPVSVGPLSGSERPLLCLVYQFIFCGLTESNLPAENRRRRGGPEVHRKTGRRSAGLLWPLRRPRQGHRPVARVARWCHRGSGTRTSPGRSSDGLG